MPLDPAAIGTTSQPKIVHWTADDACLYALGVGAGTDDLAWTTDNTRNVPQQVLPTMAVVLGMDVKVLARAGEIDWTNLVHAEQTVEVPASLPPAGEASVTTRLAEMWDKQRAAVVVLETQGTDPSSGDLLYRTRASLFIRDAGGWGGDRGRSAARPDLTGAPATTVSYATRPDQALLYRLSGDHNPLHSDSSFAARAGFDRPILHGLCTYGFTGRALIAARCDGDATRLTRMHGRFAAPVYPGDVLHIDVWDLADGHVAFQARRNDGAVVLSHGEAHLATAQ